jgi:hypothetical protein
MNNININMPLNDIGKKIYFLFKRYLNTFTWKYISSLNALTIRE